MYVAEVTASPYATSRVSPSSRNRTVARSQWVRASGRLEGNAMNPAARWIRAEM